MELIRAASAEFERAVSELPADAWERQTPAQITVREMVTHVVGGNRLSVDLLNGVDRRQALARLADDQLGDDPVAAAAESAEQQASAFIGTSPDRPVDGPGGEVPASTLLLFRLIDLVVHAWDVRRGAGLDESLDPAAVEGLWALVEPRLPELLPYGAYGDGPSGTVTDDASTQLRLLDALGRRP